MFSYACDSAIDAAEVVKQKDCHSTTIYFYSVYFFLFPCSRLFTFKPLQTFCLFFLPNIFSCMAAKKWDGHGRPSRPACDTPDDR